MLLLASVIPRCTPRAGLFGWSLETRDSCVGESDGVANLDSRWPGRIGVSHALLIERLCKQCQRNSDHTQTSHQNRGSLFALKRCDAASEVGEGLSCNADKKVASGETGATNFML